MLGLSVLLSCASLNDPFLFALVRRTIDFDGDFVVSFYNLSIILSFIAYIVIAMRRPYITENVRLFCKSFAR